MRNILLQIQKKFGGLYLYLPRDVIFSIMLLKIVFSFIKQHEPHNPNTLILPTSDA